MKIYNGHLILKGEYDDQYRKCFEDLEEINGSLVLIGTTFDFPMLRVIKEDLKLTCGASINAPNLIVVCSLRLFEWNVFNCPKLKTINLHLIVYGNITLPELLIVAVNITLGKNATLIAPKLERIGTHEKYYKLELYQNGLMLDEKSSFQALMLSYIDGYIVAYNGSKLFADMLKTVNHYVRIYANTQISINNLENINSYLELMSNANLILPNLEKIGKDINNDSIFLNCNSVLNITKVKIVNGNITLKDHSILMCGRLIKINARKCHFGYNAMFITPKLLKTFNEKYFNH